MNELTHFFLESLACSGILLGTYMILVERQVSFRWCRHYLLASTLLSVLIPLLRIPVWPGEVIEITQSVSIPEITTHALPDAPPTGITAMEICAAIYGLGAALILSVMIWQALRIRSLRRQATITRTDRFTLVSTRRRIASFSFFRSIYIWQGTPEEQLSAIVAHEASHIAHHHSAERIAMECLKAILWWNPFVWITARRLTEAEEFEADSDALNGGCDLENYMNTLFKQLFGYSPEIANGLRDSLTKKRFKMMTTQRPGRHSLLRLAATLPIVLGLLCAFSFTTRAAVVRIAATTDDLSAPAPAVEQQEQTALQPTSPSDNLVKTTVTVSENNSGKPLPGATILIQGTQIGVVTGKDGKATIAAPDGSTLKVSYIDAPTATLTVSKQQQIQTVTLHLDNTSVKKEPLYILDGVEIANLEDIDENIIDHVSVYNGASATNLYGDRAANGLVVIVSKAKAARDKAEQEKAEQAHSENNKNDEPFLVVETMPSFQGGDLNAFRQWVMTQVRYPAEAMKNNIAGRVVANFVIERDGSVSNVNILQSPDQILSDEAVRVLTSTPAGAWTPGKQRGNIVRVKYTLPIDFNIQGDKDINRGPATPKPAATAATVEELTVVGYGAAKK